MIERKKETSGVTELNKLLSRMTEEGKFPISVITDGQGLTIASSIRDGMDSDRHSASIAFIQKAILQANKQLGLGKTDEISLSYANGQHLVCRSFQIGQHDLVLAVIMSSRQQSYRRATNSAISEVRNIWSQYWE